MSKRFREEDIRGLLGVGLEGGTGLVGEGLTSSLRHDVKVVVVMVVVRSSSSGLSEDRGSRGRVYIGTDGGLDAQRPSTDRVVMTRNDERA